MTLTITPAKLKGSVTPPPSKSQAHRLLIAAALAGGESVIHNVAYSQDIDATLRCLTELGAEFDRAGDTVTVRGMGANAMSPNRRMALPHLDCGESGSTLRFLIPIALAVRGGGVFTGRGRLMERPQKPYFDLFDQKNIFYEQKDGVLTVQGQLLPGEYRLPGNVSSQFFTGLLFALPLLDGPSAILPTTELESEGYVQMTLQAMAEFGVELPATLSLPPQYHPQGNQTYVPAEATVEADWSQAGILSRGTASSTFNMRRWDWSWGTWARWNWTCPAAPIWCPPWRLWRPSGRGRPPGWSTPRGCGSRRATA